MLKSKLILLSVIGVLSSATLNGAFAAGEAGSTPPNDSITNDALDACKDRKEGDGCMYIKNDTKFTGVCEKHNEKISCSTIK